MAQATYYVLQHSCIVTSMYCNFQSSSWGYLEQVGVSISYCKKSSSTSISASQFVIVTLQTQHFLISLILIFTSEIGPFWLEIVGYQINVLSRLGQKRNLSQWDFKNIWILVVTDKE